MADAVTIEDRPTANRYEIMSDGDVAGYVRYRHETDHIVLVRTRISPAFEGRGLASALAAGVFTDLRARGIKVDAECPYMVRWITKHPESHDLLVSGARLAGEPPP